MPVSPTRVKYTDRQAQILVKDFTSIVDSVVENVDPGSIIPEGVTGTNLLNSLLQMLLSAVSSKPYSIADGTLAQFALKIIGMFGTLNLGIYADVINRIKKGDIEVTTLFSTALMKVIATKPPAALINPSNSFYVDIIKDTIQSLMENPDFTYLLFTPQAYVTFTNTTTTTTPATTTPTTSTSGNTTPTSPTTTPATTTPTTSTSGNTTPTSPTTTPAIQPTTVTPTRIDYIQAYRPYTAQQLQTFRTASPSLPTLMLTTYYKNDYNNAPIPVYTRTPESAITDTATNGDTVIKVFMSLLKAVHRQHTENIIVPNLELNAKQAFERMRTKAYEPLPASAANTWNAELLLAHKEALDLGVDIKNLTRHGFDSNYAYFKIATCMLNEYKKEYDLYINDAKSMSSAPTNSAARYKVYRITQLMCNFYDSYFEHIKSENKPAFTGYNVDFQLNESESIDMASAYSGDNGRKFNDSDQRYYAQLKSGIYRLFYNAIPKLTRSRAMADDLERTTALYSAVVSSTLAVVFNKFWTRFTIPLRSDEAQITTAVRAFYFMEKLFHVTNGYLHWRAGDESVPNSSWYTTNPNVIPAATGSKFVPFIPYYRDSDPPSVREKLLSKTSVYLARFLNHLLLSPLEGRKSGLTDSYEIDIYRDVIALKIAIMNFPEPQLKLLIYLKEYEAAFDQFLVVASTAYKSLIQLLPLKQGPTGDKRYDNLDLSKVTYNKANGMINYIP